MLHSPWLHNLLGLARSRKDRRRQAAVQRRGVRPMSETLEDRITPSTVIENAADAATLQTDLTNATAANTQYIINLTGPSSAYTLTKGTELTVSAAASGSSTTIAGTGQSITGNGNRVFEVQLGANVILQDLTIAGGTVASTSSAQGGGIEDNGGNVTLSNVTVQGNKATGSIAKGGGIFVSGGGNLTVENGSVIGSNKAISQSVPSGNYTSGGGVYVSGASTVAIRDSTLSNNSAQGAAGASDTTGDNQNATKGGSASGGGLYVVGSGWTATLIGDTFLGNSALGGNGGNAAAGSNASGSNEQGGNGGLGGYSGAAQGGAAFFTDNGNNASTRLTILDDPAAPTSHPSLFVDNIAQAGDGGNGGAGGASTGTANNSLGGDGGSTGGAGGGALVVTSDIPPPPAEALAVQGDYYLPFTVNIGNTNFYGNKISSGNAGAGGAADRGGTGSPGEAGPNGSSGEALGGGLELEAGNSTLVNCTVANNTAATGAGFASEADGGGIYGGDTLDNNTITQNILIGERRNIGSGVDGAPTLYNNLIQGNQSIGSSAFDLDTSGQTLSNASNNFITSISPNAVNTTTNIIGNSQTQLGGAVGVTFGGKPSGGPIYYPLLPGTVSVGAGTTAVLSTIAAVEGTTPANATDEIGNLLSANAMASGSLDLGAVQSVPTSPSPPPAPPPPLSLVQEILAITLDSDALLFANDPPALMFLNSLSERFLGQPLPPTADLLSTIETDFAALLNTILADLR